MSDFGKTVISCSKWQEIVRTINGVSRALPSDMRVRFVDIFSSYLARYGLEGCYQRMNNRTVSQIFAEYQPEEVRPIASGELDGVLYALYEAPPSDTIDREGLTDQ
jgi:hypothetical protein